MKLIKFIFVFLLLITSSAFAQNTTKIVLFSAAGGQVHANALRLQNELSKQLNKTFIIDIKTGAEGLIAAEYVNSYKNSNSLVLMMGTAQHWNGIPNRNNLSHLTDFHLISYYGTFPAYVITGKHRTVNSFSQLLEMSKTTKVSYGLTQNHPMRALITELFQKHGNSANVKEITYRSGSQSVVDAVNGNLDFIVLSPDNVRQLVGEGKLKIVSALDITFKIDTGIKTLMEENIRVDNIEKYSAHMFVWANNSFNLEEIEKIKNIIEQVIESGNTSGIVVNNNYLQNPLNLLRKITK
jgi:tripartite-type tricarboxylate transporter receptor subunit TctC